ncbi:hypothetical protein Zm00014a_023670 [Zea mays]|uniref:Invertebrate defensins family profile domain-containing protein n=2 Tax=Zea mays TaxID=4577 RepID=A0A1D6JH05_MAIZE|nr:uncharacterized protein LOC103642158 isoform X2 [Zea mays]AQK46935.1 hypothetical protein ZEAMMB73_Zm00001d026520 [Zea mays]PWZ44271.1 hypothetical protein Zm00014a_023670 [Zea mays]|eukprot:XP_008663695.1 uncharacterized protein LOC103642158 isoform X2 [Zea mays]
MASSKVVVMAATDALLLIMFSFLILPSPSDGKGMCPLFRSIVPECRDAPLLCIARCQDKGYVGGFCTTQQICMCAQCKSSLLLQQQQHHRFQLAAAAAPEPSATAAAAST